MTNDIIAPENLVYKKPDLMNDNREGRWRLPRRLCRICLSLPRHRLAGGRTRSCARRCHRYQALLARPPGVYLSGRRRLGLHRYGRDHSRSQSW